MDLVYTSQTMSEIRACQTHRCSSMNYSPIVDPMIARDRTAPLLWVVPVDHTQIRASSLFAEFERTHFVPLRTTRCNIFRIFIYNDVGEKGSSHQGEL